MMAQKPPAFQFYAKDWRSSPTVRRMTLKEEGLYIRMCALAWDSDEPGIISLSEEEICRELRVFSKSLRRFLAKYSSTFCKVDGKYLQSKLHLQWLKYQEIQQKKTGRPYVEGGSASASAFAFASANQKKEQEPTPNPSSLSLDQIKTQLKTVGAMPRYAMSDRAINSERNRQREALKAKHPRLFA
jgi:hypothetical protein